MRTLFLLATSLILTAAVYAQAAPMKVQNFTSCDFWVYGHADPAGTCIAACMSGPICVPAGGAVLIPVCGPASWAWVYFDVVPVINNCTAPCPMPVKVSPPGIACNPPVLGANHCACGPYTADMMAIPGQLVIY